MDTGFRWLFLNKVSDCKTNKSNAWLSATDYLKTWEQAEKEKGCREQFVRCLLPLLGAAVNGTNNSKTSGCFLMHNINAVFKSFASKKDAEPKITWNPVTANQLIITIIMIYGCLIWKAIQTRLCIYMYLKRWLKNHVCFQFLTRQPYWEGSFSVFASNLLTTLEKPIFNTLGNKILIGKNIPFRPNIHIWYKTQNWVGWKLLMTSFQNLVFTLNHLKPGLTCCSLTGRTGILLVDGRISPGGSERWVSSVHLNTQDQNCQDSHQL